MHFDKKLDVKFGININHEMPYILVKKRNDTKIFL